MVMIWIAIIITLSLCSAAVTSPPFDYPTANLSSSWTNSVSANLSVTFSDNSTVRSILLRGSYGPRYAAGFYCNGACDSYLFAVFIVQTNSGGYITNPTTGFPQVVWSANRNHPVGINATLQLTADGDLVLRHAGGELAWSTNTAGKGVVGLNLTELGNLVLFDSSNAVVWQSFDFPTDCLVPGQMLAAGKNLTASASSTNWTEGGLFTFSLTERGLVATVQSDPPQVYFINPFTSNNHTRDSIYARFENGSLALYANAGSLDVGASIDTPLAARAQYMKLGPDGHLRVIEWGEPWKEVADLLTGYLGDCDYPMACGVYGVCSNGQCSCPMKSNSDGEIFSLMNNDKGLTHYNSSVSVKVQTGVTGVTPSPGVEVFPTAAKGKGKSSLLGPILGSTLGVFCAVVLIGAAVLVYRRRTREIEDVEEDYLDHVPGMPNRFSFEELAVATDNFTKKLGEGGFGSVYEGTLKDGTRIAVKCLDGVGHIRKSFLAEVETIGSIHHINLVRLVGFCADKSHRLLVYEYMCNGSLEKWIYNRNSDPFLDWNRRRKIILDVAKGLVYLHEDCWQKILHLDIKPQNILLDEDFNAKFADFGLSKLIDRNQSQVVTTMRGTPGYLAPEWLNGIITEKVDVYSFGVLVLEL